MTDSLTVDGHLLPVWPEGTRVEMLDAPNTAVVDFDDCETVHPGLARRMLELEQDPAYRHWISRGGCGTKVRAIDRWDCGSAALVHARALRFAALALGTDRLYVDECWGNVYRRGDYCLPHGHLRAVASLVYLLDPGDPDAEDPTGGRFCFCDPRIPFCCPDEPGRTTQLLLPDLRPGSLLIFPAEYIHSVAPYHGERPRLTLSWNITLERLPGSAADGWAPTAA
jgi:hypothetical protein